MAGMVTSGILFAINTTGGGKAKLAFAAVAAGVFLLGRKMNEARLNAEKFADSWTRLDTTQKNLVRSMEKTGKGLIDTNAEVLAVHKVTEAGMTANSRLMDALALVAIDRAKKMGEGAAGATTRVVKLTDAITKGQTRALKEYGIELDATESLTHAQNEGMEKIILRAKGLTAEIHTLSEQTFALNNNWETFLGLSLGRVGTIGVLGELNDTFSILNDSLMSTDDGLAAATLSAEQFAKSLQADALEMFGFTEQAWAMNSALGRQIELHGQLKKSKAARAGMPEFLEQMQWMKDNPNQAAAIAGAGLSIEDSRAAIGAQMKAEQREGITGARKSATWQATLDADAGGGGGGGGGGRAAAKAPALVGPDKWAAELALDQARKEEQIAHNEWRLENDADYLDEMIDQEMKADAELQSELMEMYTVSQEEQAKWDAVANEEKWAAQLEAQDQERLLSVEHHEWLLMNSREYAAKQAEIDKQAALARLGGLKAMFTNLSSLMQTENKTAFYVGKAAAYSATVINTAQAAMASYKAMAGIPIVGPAIGAAAAATAIITGGVQLATIKKQRFGSAGGGVSAGPVGSTGGGYLGGGGGYAAGGAGAAQTTHITVMLGEEEFHGWSLEANKKASQSGKPAFQEEAA